MSFAEVMSVWSHKKFNLKGEGGTTIRKHCKISTLCTIRVRNYFVFDFVLPILWPHCFCD